MPSSPSHSFTRLPTSSTVDEDSLALLHSEEGLTVDPSTADHDDILDGLLSRVGYGTFQKRLLIMCGFGWLADNMWLQTVAIVLPRVQDHFDVDDRWVGLVSSALFTGMTFGAFFWGSYSDTKGRKTPYTLTLTITTIFGVLSSLSFSFWSLCLMLFFLGFGVGGNMPTDGALYLEFLPKEYHYLLTFMSVFFSLGAVLASVLGYAILPYTSCPEASPDNPMPTCDVSTQNTGWRIMLACAGLTTFAMVLVRSFWLKLPETPKFLLSQDRTKETLVVLQDIAQINGRRVHIDSTDLPSRHQVSLNPSTANSMEAERRLSTGSDIQVPQLRATPSTHEQEEPMLHSERHDADEDMTAKMAADVYETVHNGSWALLFSPRWLRTTLLVWAIWTFTSVAFTMFNVFLPKYLETLGFQGEAAPTRKDVYWDYMIYSLAGVPGSVLASWMIETFLGRKGTMAASAFGSSLALFLFSIINSRVTMLISSSAVSFLATLLYAVIYGYTPEVFDTSVRGTAVGTASGLGRIAGIASPIVAGFLFTVSKTLPLYVSIGGFGAVGLCVVLLPYETRSHS